MHLSGPSRVIKFLYAPAPPPPTVSQFFVGPQMTLAYLLDAISQGPKNSRYPVPNPLPLALVLDMHAPNHYARGIIGA
jgi:hypothetical protein